MLATAVLFVLAVEDLLPAAGGSLAHLQALPPVWVLITAPKGNLLAFFTRKERLVSVATIVAIVLTAALLVVPMVALEEAPPSPSTPSDLVDSDEDGVSDVVEVFVYGSNPQATDTSEDGVPDGWKAEHAKWDTVYRRWGPSLATNDSHRDLDGDGLTIREEYEIGTDPWEPDTSGDGFSDGWLHRSGLDPTEKHAGDHRCAGDGMTIDEKHERDLLACATDSSGNGLPDQAALDGEWTVGGQTFTFEPTVPAAYSTGGSGVPDGWLIFHGLDPHDPAHRFEDIAGNGLSTLEAWGWMASQGLTDVDDWGDGLEPQAFSSAGHGIPDGWLLRHDLDPLDPTLGDQDADEDGLSLSQEHDWGTDPTLADSDEDGLDDGQEVHGWTITVDGEEHRVHSNPLLADSSGDGLPDLAQHRGRLEKEGRTIEFPPTNPMSTDTDGDGLQDIVEITAMPPSMPALDPTDSDTSGSGLLDGEEWTLFEEAARRAGAEPEYAGLVAGERGVSPGEVPGLLDPVGDLDGDGVPNVMDPDTDGDDLKDGKEVRPDSRGGRQLPASDPTLADADGDGLPDAWEVRFTRFATDLGGWLLDPMKTDSDGDGVTDGDEDLETGCFDDPDLAGDGIPWEDKGFPNRLELEHGTDPLECDTVGDGLPDGWTVFTNERLQEAGLDLSLNPLVVDSMGDGLRDGDRVSPVPYTGEGKVRMDGSPACPEEGGKRVCLWRWGTEETSVADRFKDMADIVDLVGPCQGLDACAVVLELNLSMEVGLHTDPSKWDTSGDGFQDAWKVLHRFGPTDPTVPQAGGDPDSDGVSTWDEYVAGTDPLDPDTDKGGVPDGPDIQALDPTDDTGDCDWDGIADREEAVSGDTAPGNPDTSGDGLLDGEYNPEGCQTASGPLEPVVGVDIVAVPGDGGDAPELLGSEGAGVDPSKWDTSGDGLPDGWKVLYDLNPLVRHSPQVDQSGDGITLIETYQLGRPAWWDETVHGAWWFGTSPQIESSRDLDGDGLDDTFFDPEPLSPTNDCQLPSHWTPPPAWNDLAQAPCLATPPAGPEQATVIRGLGQLAYEHVLDAGGDPEGERRGSGAPSQVTVRAQGLQVDQAIGTGPGFDVTVELCRVEGDTCSQPPSLTPPSVGLYASYRSQGAQPDPRQDLLLCILSPSDGWQASGTCSLAPGQRPGAPEEAGLITAPHRHGFVGPTDPWRIEAGDIQPGRLVRLTAWPLPSDRGALLAPEVNLDDHPPPEVQRTPSAQAEIHLPPDLVLERGEPRQVLLTLTDGGGHPLPDHRVEATWQGQALEDRRTNDNGTTSLELDPGEPDAPRRAWLNVSVPSVGAVEGTEASFGIPVRLPVSLQASTPGGSVPGTLPVDLGLVDPQGRPVTNVTVDVRVSTALGASANATGTTGPNGNATVAVPLPPDAQPGQVTVEARFPGDTRWAPDSWRGLADLRVTPEVTVTAPDQVDATQGAQVQVGLHLLSGDPLVPAPGDPVELAVSVGGARADRTVHETGPDGNVTVSVPGGSAMALGDQEVLVDIRSDRFVENTSTTRPVRVVAPVEVGLSPEVLGAGVENNVTVTVDNLRGQPVPHAPVHIALGQQEANGTTGPDGLADLSLEVPADASLGAHPLEIEVGGTNTSLPLSTEVPVEILLGTVIEVPEVVEGSVNQTTLGGRLVTSAGDPVPRAPLVVDIFGQHEITTDGSGYFTLVLHPPPDVETGRINGSVLYPGDQGRAPTRAGFTLDLSMPTSIQVADPGPLPVNRTVGLEGRVLASTGPPVTGGTVTAEIGGVQTNASVAEDGTFQVELPSAGLAPGEQLVAFTYDPAPGYAASSLEQRLTFRQEVQLRTDQRATEDGIHLTVQAVRGDGEPLSGVELVVLVPGSPLLLETDADGVARADFAHGVLTPGTEIQVQFPGDDRHASAHASVEVPPRPLLPPGRTMILSAMLVVLLAVEAVVLWRALRRRRLVRDVLQTVDDLEHRLRAGDEVKAVVMASYRRLQAALEAAGWEEEAHHTHRMFLTSVFQEADIPTRHLDPFLDLVDRAQYDPEPLDHQDRNRSLTLASRLARDLRGALGRVEAA